MPQSNTVVVKIGSTLVANTERLTPRFGFIQRMLEDVAKLRERGTNVILCSSGAVALGLKIVGERPETAGVSDKQAAAACGMPILTNAYKQIGHEFDFEIAQVLLTLGDFEDHRRFLNTRNTVFRLLEAGVMPIINENDSITTEEIRVGDNDRLAAKVAQMVDAKNFIILTEVDGLYDRHPDEEGAEFISEVTDVAPFMEATKGKSTLGTGGMTTKLMAANIAQEAGVTTYIAHGEHDNPLSSVLDGERRATKFIAHDTPTTGWERWIANRLQMAGSIGISDELADEIADGNRAIRREDILSIEGDFSRGDVLHIYDQQGQERARGLSDFTSEELRVLAVNPHLDAEQLLGYKTKGEVIRDKNLVALEGRHLLWDAPEGGELSGHGERPAS
ncbi:glutamate 5-kinase [Citromicrobium bathyomarinum]|uniref:glutamate 5-kinase n=1 Tax=Citromicrobium TaxID=72173 RepID=UPI0001DD08D3|nr:MULTISPECIES: glutamate 5-kinase [Citromicrobium]MAY78286.1 glutamate 5-kinase [Citromicrobium sp.]ALG61687.1 glutamate 5-kinase [Citromicrobium sp. JL477]KPM12865.1 glutamate 5-kinase [Citromicrobium sp. JL1351]KPM18065.1 glutamate 5-kinase [Citromicrobium sp. WPS32]KPM21106.1 glutamate 5-kinase [Citromicrobium sp. JL31]|tara:strand:- start:71 stop:1243 length:1173 start_codon:yes stop_codon:yes gene_type:complete